MNASVIFADTAWEPLFVSGTRVCVDAVFRRAFTLRSDASDDLYTMFFAGGYNAPRAATIDLSPNADVVCQGEEGVAIDGELRFSQLTVKFGGRKVLSNFMTELSPPTPEKVQSLDNWLQSNARPGSFYGATPGDAVSQAMVKRLSGARRNFQASMQEDSEAQISEKAQNLIGLGVGLTPSGDDYLTGWLAVLASSGRTMQGLEAAIANNLTRTTKVSQLYIKAALNREFAWPVRELCRAVSADESVISATETMMSHGATSGQDIMTGMIDAWKQLTNERKGL